MANQANKKFTQAPLPFIGQKRMFLKHFSQILNDNISGDGEGWTIVDGLVVVVYYLIPPKNSSHKQG